MRRSGPVQVSEGRDDSEAVGSGARCVSTRTRSRRKSWSSETLGCFGTFSVFHDSASTLCSRSNRLTQRGSRTNLIAAVTSLRGVATGTSLLNVPFKKIFIM